MTAVDKDRSRARWVLVTAVALVLGAAAALGTVVAMAHKQSTGPPDARTVPLPQPPKNVVKVRIYFQGDGQLLLDLMRATSTVGTTPSQENNCSSLLSDTLPAIAQPPKLFAVASAIPDGPTSEMAIQYLDSLMRWLAACKQGQTVSGASLDFDRVVFQRQLAKLGVSQ